MQHSSIFRCSMSEMEICAIVGRNIYLHAHTAFDLFVGRIFMVPCRHGSTGLPNLKWGKHGPKIGCDVVLMGGICFHVKTP